ncbi:hypothetical protein FRB99_001067, partial [Tulasnella sp. 403]
SRIDGSFWKSIAEVEVGNRRLLAKVYDTAEGEREFLRDIDRLKRLQTWNMLRIYGHIQQSEPPIIVFKAASAQPLINYLFELVVRNEKQIALMTTWKLMISMKEVGAFIMEKDPDHGVHLEGALADAKVNENGQLIVTPFFSGWKPYDPWFPDPNPSPELYVKRVWDYHVLWKLAFYKLNQLRYALRTNAESLLNTEESILHDPTLAAVQLRGSWSDWHHNPDARMAWIADDGQNNTERPQVGDIGVFRSLPGMTTDFKRLGKVEDKRIMGEVITNITWEYRGVEPRPSTTVSGNATIRRTFVPLRREYACFDEPDSDDDIEDCVDDDDPIPIRRSRGLSSGRMQWEWAMECKDKTPAHDYLRQNAQRWAEEYKVTPDELVLVTGTTGIVDLGQPGEIDRLGWRITRPVYFHLHMERTPIQWYWTFRNASIEAANVPAHKRKLAPLRLPEVKLSSSSSSSFAPTPSPSPKSSAMDIGTILDPFSANAKAVRAPPSYELRPKAPTTPTRVRFVEPTQQCTPPADLTPTARRTSTTQADEERQQRLWDDALDSLFTDGAGVIDLQNEGIKHIPSTIIDASNLVVLPKSRSSTPQISRRSFDRSTSAPAAFFSSPKRVMTRTKTIALGTETVTAGDRDWTPEYGQLKPPELHILLASNHITVLPPELFALKGLTMLSLRSNQLSRIPAAIALLTNLEELNLSNNDLEYLPSEMVLLGLKKLWLNANPLREPPAPALGNRQLSELKANFEGVRPLQELALSVLLSPTEATSSSSYPPPTSRTKLEDLYDPPLLADAIPANLYSKLNPSLSPQYRSVGRKSSKAYPEANDAALMAKFNKCPSPHHQYDPPGCVATFVDPAEERLEWVQNLAKDVVSDLHGGRVPILWRGCGRGCLDFLDESEPEEFKTRTSGSEGHASVHVLRGDELEDEFELDP